ncbi:MAG TPA: NAD-dependent epimerase/dehydratase family protein [Methylophilaceae bacterium]|nr:NAD-dependent epimerase/dehydratase family protein [Methylophilaceae bacterium]
MQTSNPKLLIAGFGELGQKVAKLAMQQGLQVTGLRRNMPAAEAVPIIRCDVSEPATLTPLAGLAPDILLYCVAADSPTDASYKAQYVDGLKNVLYALKGNPLKHIFFISSTRVYGQSSDDDLLDEDTPAVPIDFGGERLLEAEQIAETHGIPATVLRLSGIYGPGRLRMLRLAQQPPEEWPDNSWTNRIHIDDAAGFIVQLITRRQDSFPLSPCYLVTDQLPAPMHEVLNWLAKRMGLPGEANIPRIAGGKRLDNKLLRQTGYTLRYPSFREGYAELLQSVETKDY